MIQWYDSLINRSLMRLITDTVDKQWINQSQSLVWLLYQWIMLEMLNVTRKKWLITFWHMMVMIYRSTWMKVPSDVVYWWCLIIGHIHLMSPPLDSYEAREAVSIASPWAHLVSFHVQHLCMTVVMIEPCDTMTCAHQPVSQHNITAICFLA
jgi:hypothetical protein